MPDKELMSVQQERFEALSAAEWFAVYKDIFNDLYPLGPKDIKATDDEIKLDILERLDMVRYFAAKKAQLENR